MLLLLSDFKENSNLERFLISRYYCYGNANGESEKYERINNGLLSGRDKLGVLPIDGGCCAL